MSCMMTSPAVASFARAGSATMDAARDAKDCFFAPTPTGACGAMRAVCHAGFASAIAATRATSLAASAAASAGEASEKMMPFAPGLATANHIAKNFAASLDTAATNAESLGMVEDDWEMKLAICLSEEDARGRAAAAAARMRDDEQQLKLALSMSLSTAGPPEVAAPTVPLGEPTAEAVTASPASPASPTPFDAPTAPVPSGDAALGSEAKDGDGDAKDKDGDDAVVDTKDDASEDGVLVEAAEEPVWLREAGERVSERLEPVSTHAALLDDLHEMGFTDRALNERMLTEHGGNLKRAVRALVDEMYM